MIKNIKLGYEYPSAGVRLKMLEEAFKYICNDNPRESNIWWILSNKRSNKPTKTITKTISTLWVCGGGEKILLKLLAKYGDYGNWDVDVEGFIYKSDIKEHCEVQKREYSDIKKTLHTNVIIGKIKRFRW